MHIHVDDLEGEKGDRERKFQEFERQIMALGLPDDSLRRVLEAVYSLRQALDQADSIPAAHQRSARPFMILVRAVGQDSGQRLMKISDVVYFFLGSAIEQRLMELPAHQLSDYTGQAVYARAAQGVFRTELRSIRDLTEILDSRVWAPLNRSVIANIFRIAQVDFRSKQNRVSVMAAPGRYEWLVLSRRAYQALRPRFR